MRAFEQSGSEYCKLALLFPGQGTQHVGMGAQVLDQRPETSRVWDCASDIAGFDVRKLCAKGPMPKLDKTAFQQVAVTTVNLASLEALRTCCDIPVVGVAGHSVGEFSALYAAGVLGMEDVFRAVSARGQIMQRLAERTAGGMYAIKGVDHDAIVAFIEEQCLQARVRVANDNSPRQQVISGCKEALKELLPQLLRGGFEHVRLPVNGAWHSHLMEEGEGDFQGVLDGLSFTAPQVAVYTNQAAAVVSDPDEIRAQLLKNLYSTVRWRETVRQLADDGILELVEVGPKRVLGRMLLDFPELPASMHARHVDDLLSPQREEA